MAADRCLLVVGAYRDETTRRVQEAASAAGVAPEFVTRCDEAIPALAQGVPLAILLRMDAPGAAQMCAHVRSQARFGEVPIFGVARDRSDLAFTELFSWGGDDLVSVWSPHPLVRRLRPLASRTVTPTEQRATRDRTVLVAGADAAWRSIMGRALYNGGFAVRFVGSEQDLLGECAGESVKLVVVAEELGAGGIARTIAQGRQGGSKAVWVVVAPPKRMPPVMAALAGQSGVSVADGFAPPENVIFMANELLARRGIDQRESPRLLYGTTVVFRQAGRDEDETGFSYNVSAGGVYVRTLAAPEAGQEVWVEMWPPRSERRVRLAGTVAWKRPFGAHERATVPAGFGVKLTDGLGGDLERWKAGYAAFADVLLGKRGSPSSPEV